MFFRGIEMSSIQTEAFDHSVRKYFPQAYTRMNKLNDDHWTKYLYQTGFFSHAIHIAVSCYLKLQIESKSVGTNLINIYSFAQSLESSFKLLRYIQLKPSFQDLIHFIHVFNGIFWILDVISVGGIKNTYVYMDFKLFQSSKLFSY
jgi:hypothetical protein